VKYYVKLTMCDGSGSAGPYRSEEDAHSAMMVSVNWRQKNCNETWRSTSKLKWASTNGHTLEITSE
jgi:hypothetical protein